MQDDVLTREVIEEQLTTKWLGRPVTFFDVILSTNTWLAEQAILGAPHAALAVADVQTAGRGRLGRVWDSPPGTGLLFSLLFRPAPPVMPGQVGMVVGAGVAVGLAERLGVEAKLKWPNDVLIGGKKVAGLLGDATLRDGRPEWVVVGAGLNVNLAPDDFPKPAPGGVAPTSLLVELGHPLQRAPLLAALLAAIEPRYEALVAGQPQVDEWRRLSATLGQAVQVTGGVTVEGVAEDIAEDGSLLVRQADGTVVTVAAGDVSLRPI